MTEHASHGVQGETEKISTVALLATSVGLMVFLLVVIAISVFAVRGFVTQSKHKKEAQAVSGLELNSLREEGKTQLSTYGRIDGNRLRIPIEKAMERVIEEQTHRPVVDSALPPLKPKAKKKKKKNDPGH